MCENMDNTHARRFDDTVRRRAGERGAIMTLRDCPRAMRVVVDGIDLDDRHRFRLCEIGLAPGAGLRVMQLPFAEWLLPASRLSCQQTRE